MTTRIIRSLTTGLLVLAPFTAHAQTAAPSAASQSSQTPDPKDSRLETMSRLLMDTQKQLEQTQQQLNQLRSELDELRSHDQAAKSSPTPPAPGITDTIPAATLAEKVAHQQEEQEVLQAEVKQHDQTKLETVSKYPVKVYGLLLFNAYSNAGVVDNPDLPSVALARTPGVSHGSIGGSFRQTLLGIRAEGPQFLGARTSADLSIDFFGGDSYSYYDSSNGSVRLRRANIRLAWDAEDSTGRSRNELNLGVDSPLISPLSPTSFATVAEPALAWSGNLWTWAPQIQYKQTFALPGAHPDRTFELQGGLWDPPVIGSADASSARILSPGELSRRPGLLGRASIHAGSSEHPFSFGVGGYSDRQSFYEGQQIRMWAVTSDWQIPLSQRLQLAGEIYRGRGLGGFGGGAYKDVLTGVDLHTGLSRTLGLNAVGGWTQLKAELFRGTEANLIYGQDGGFSSDFRQLNLSGSAYALEQSARSQMIVGNIVYRPRTYLILSPEYRRILSWKTYGPAAQANIYTLSLGYQF